MISVKLMEANNFRLQEKTYKKYMMHSIIDLYTVFPVSAVLNGHELSVNGRGSSVKN